MSAINGVFERRACKASARVLASSLAALNDYGPDGSACWIAGAVGFGYQRAALTPEQYGENLPTQDTVARLTITADARLDNRTDLLAALGLPTWTALSDSHLILRCWQKWGRDCPRYLIGDFAFAIWDARQQTLFCARDHMGVRPFYYCLTPERFVFASDIRGVLAAPDIANELDDAYVTATLLDNSFFSNDRTYFRAIRRLPPSHSLSILPDRERLERYWFPADAREVRFSNDADYVEAAREIYAQAVRDRLRTTFPIGVHLSGGLDSSSVAVLAARQRRHDGQSPPIAFCWQPQPDGKSASSAEHSYIQAVSAQEGLETHFCPMTREHALAVLRKDPALEPVTSTMLVETTTQRQAAAQGVRVMLSGWGGDEGLSSYGRGYCSELLLGGHWKELYRQSQWQHPNPWKFMALEALLLLFPDRDTAAQRIANRSWRTREEANSLVHRDVLRNTRRLRAVPCREASVRSTLFWSWENGSLTERIESWHVHGAQRGISYAYPLLDRRLLEFVGGLPRKQIVREKRKRWLMSRTVEGILPADVGQQSDKRDPVRIEQSLSVAKQTLGLIGKQLQTAPALPKRSCYLDMPTLLQRLRPESLEQNSRIGSLLRAAQFLDF